MSTYSFDSSGQHLRTDGAARLAASVALSVCIAFAGCGKKPEAPKPTPAGKEPVAATPEPAKSSEGARSPAESETVLREAQKKIQEAPLGKLKVLSVIGKGGTEALKGPMGVAVDADDNLYVADTGNARVAVFDKDGKFLRSIGSPGQGDGKFKNPIDVAVGPGGIVYVLDRGTGFVQSFGRDGAFRQRAVGEGTGVYNPSGLAASADAVFVADTGTGRLLKFPASGERLPEIARGGWGPGELREPTGIFVDGESLLVVDDQARKVSRYGLDGKYQASFATAAAGITRIVRMKDGSIVVGLESMPRYDKDGGKVLARYGELGGEPGKFRGPAGLAVDKAGNLYVADSGNNRVQKLALQ